MRKESSVQGRAISNEAPLARRPPHNLFWEMEE